MFLYKHFVHGAETTELADIIRNINNVLTTKRGYGYFIANFGLSEYTTFRTTEETVTTLTREIAENIRLFEPRVELIEIDEEYSDGQRPRLIVNLRLRERKEKLRLVVDLADRSFDIRPVPPKERA